MLFRGQEVDSGLGSTRGGGNVETKAVEVTGEFKYISLSC